MTRLAVDTSALLSILQGEPDAERFAQTLAENAGDAAVSSANLLEAMIVMEARSPDTGTQDLRSILEIFTITVEPVTAEQIELGFRAWKRFGKGRHPAGLNFGDCFAYALSKQLGAPLLFKGEGFAQTDVVSAWD